MPKRIPIAALLLGAAIFHITWSLRYAYANILAQQETADALTHATQLTPWDADYYGRLASLDPENRARWLDTALKLNPRSALLWIEYAVNAEVSGDRSTAESSFLEAARYDHQYIPRWTLAAFYFRQRDMRKFQTWARQALEMAWGDALPLFQMATQLGMSPDDIRRTMLPDRPPVLSAFISECLRLNNFDEALRTARRLVEIGSGDDRSIVLYSVESLFQANRRDDAVDLWNRAVAAHWMPHPTISRDRLITNPSFSFQFLPAGFDWKQPTLDGVVFWRLGSPRGLMIEFSGRQPESCTLLSLPLPLEPGKSYTLQTSLTASRIAGDAGLKWRLGTQEWDALKDTMTFESPSKPQPLQLALIYNRALGTKRIEGNLSIHSVAVTPSERPQ